MSFRSGANGAGKTTTFRMLINDIKPSAGQIVINGININQSVCFSAYMMLRHFLSFYSNEI